MRVVSLFIDKNYITGLTSEGGSTRFWARLISKRQGNESRHSSSRLESLSLSRARVFHLNWLLKIRSNFQPIFISRPTIDHQSRVAKNRLRIIYFWCCATRCSLDDVLFLAHMRVEILLKNIEVISSGAEERKSVIAICLWAKTEKRGLFSFHFFFREERVFELLMRTQIICCNFFLTIRPDGWRNFKLSIYDRVFWGATPRNFTIAPDTICILILDWT